ncbi:MAG: VTT domain-containing protein [Clostridiales bacterium]|jgi:uncharacterized membrane protein YdjX (TVP38/TMEM64 family)|nr:VTT domain-containing protein [Clostridiales bacterium]
MLVSAGVVTISLIVVVNLECTHFVYKTTVSILWILAVWIVGYSVVHFAGWQGYFSQAQLEVYLDWSRDWIAHNMALGLLLYVLIVVLHTLVIPVSTTPFVLFGVAVFGSHLAFGATVVATVSGSIATFAIGKTFGKKLVTWLIGQDKFDKYNSTLQYSGKYYLATMFLLPVFPDDILCLMAGASNLKYREFVWITILTRPPMIAFTCYVGNGELISFSGWGILVWIVIIAIFVAMFVCVHLYARHKQRQNIAKTSDTVSQCQR